MADNVQEDPLFQRSGVTVTKTRLIMMPPASDAQQTIYLQGVTSISHSVEKGTTPLPGFFILAGIGLILLSAVGSTKEFLADFMLEFTDTVHVVGPFLMWPAIIGLGLAVIGGIWLAALEDSHELILRSSSGEQRALVSTDGEWVDDVREAVDRAIIARG